MGARGMPRFGFESIGPSGALIRGTLEARTSGLALDELIAAGQTPVSLREISGGAGASARLGRAIGWHSFDYRLFLHELGVLLKAGLPVERALNVLAGIAPNDRHAMRVGQILERVRAGAPLSQGFAAVVREAPAHISRLLAAGEMSGKLAEIIVRLAQSLDRAKALRDKLISGLTYPAVLVLAMAAVLWVVFATVLPRLVPMFQDAGSSLPEATAILLAVDLFLTSYGWLLLVLAAALVALFIYAMREPRSRLVIDRFFLSGRLTFDLPARYEAARFCRSLQTLLEGGLSLESALALARGGSSNSWFIRNLADAQAGVAEGEHLRTALEKSAVLPPLVVEFAAVGEETGRVGAMMGEVAAILDHDVETRLDRLSSLVVPVATLVLGALVSGIMAGVVSGILAVNDVAR